MNGYEKRRRKKEEIILKTTEQLILKKGITATSMEEIARVAGVSKVTIFNYFGTKDSLVRHVFQRYMDAVFEQMDQIMCTDMPFLEKLNLVLSAGDQINDSIDNRFFQSIAWEDPALQQLYDEISSARGIPMLVSLMEQGKEEGLIDHNLPTKAVIAYIKAITGIVKEPSFLKADDAYKHGIQKLFLYGLFGR